jgi:hypothetical protein
MGFINLAEKTISAKLVYYGAGAGGKTTSLQAVHRIMCPRNEVQLVSINTEEDSTLLFDFLPINLGTVNGFRIRIQGFTVPGQPKYRRMRRYVLQGADAVVFVIDSQASRLEENRQSLESLIENLRANDLDPEALPVVLQYNKRDLREILGEEQLDRHFKWRQGLTAFPSVATEHRGVFETFVHAAGLLIESKVRLYGLEEHPGQAEEVAEGARQRLWEMFDRGRDEAGAPRAPASEPMRISDPVEAAASEAEAPIQPTRLTLFSDDDLRLAPLPTAAARPLPSLLDDERGLLDKAVRSNVELVERYGELDRRRALLERKNQELVEVAQNTVHDLIRPLSAIKLLLGSMEKGYLGEIADPLRAGLDNGLAAVQMMERLIDDLLDSSRLDYQGVQLSFEAIDTNALVAGVLETLRPEITAAGASVRVEDLPPMKGDTWALTKVFMNLIGNALQYRADDRKPEVRVYAREDISRTIFVVEDNGIGIPEDDRERVFRRFERGSNATAKSGTGLGLHIVREIAMGHGGSVWVEPGQRCGTRFLVSMPLEPVMPPHSSLSNVEPVA